MLADGDIDEAVKLAERVLQIDKTDRIARLVLGVRALKQKQYPAARQHIAPVGARPDHRSDRDAALGLDACYGPSDAKAAIETIDRLTGPEWYAIFKDLHAGLILDLAGNRRKPASGSSGPTSSIQLRCAWSRPMAAGSRAMAARTRR